MLCDNKHCDSMVTREMICSCLKCIIFWLLTAPPYVDGCSVHPSSVVVTVAETVLLTCSTSEGGSIASWHIPINILEKVAIYTAPVYKEGGTLRTPAKIAQGYFVTRPADNETALHMNKTSLSQAGLYVCTCDLQSTAATTVVVLVSEPTFTTIQSDADVESVSLKCSMSFNASSDISCELRIEDASESTVARRNESTANNGLIVCNLEHTVIANTSADQWYTCNVNLSNKGNTLYSMVLNSTVQRQPDSSTANVLSNGGENQTGTASQFEKGEESSQRLAIGLSVIIFAVVIIIAVVVYFIIRSRERDKMLIRQHSDGQSTELSSNRPQRPPQFNRYDKKNIGGRISEDAETPSFNDVQQNKMSLKEHELTLFDNDLYSATSKQLDPSDGYFAEEAIYLEIK